MTAEKRSIRIKTELESQIGTISCDPVRLRQIIWNLLTNAIKFSPEGSSIEVVLKRIQTSSGDQAQIQVIDRGKGVAPDFLPHIFDPFSQADSSSTRIHGGLGLGLAIVRNLVELQSGNIQVESQGEGRGTTFTVNLPLYLDQPVQDSSITSPITSTDPISLNGVRVLLVDDEENTRRALTVTLHTFGADVRAVASAGEAFTALPRFKPHVLVSDIAMPGEDGYSLIRKIRALEPNQGGQTPSLALTAYAGAEDIKRALSAGFQAHIAKPVEASELVRVIWKFADRQK